MSDEIASATLQTSQKAIEVTLELIKMLAPLVKQLLSEVYHKSVDGINDVSSKIANARALGTVSAKNLVVEAQKANSPISATSNFLARDAEQIAAKAKEYKIPIAIIGSGEKQTIEFLDRDKGIIEQITNEVLQDRLKEAPQSVKCFNISENSVTAMKAVMEENGIDCQFTKTADGKVKCVYPAEMTEQVAVVKEDYKQLHSEVADKCSIKVNVPETERQMEISARIDALTNAEIGSEQRSNVCDSILSDMQNRNVDIPQYSEHNMEIIEREMPYAKQAAGKAFWEQQGYTLNENAKGIEIAAPQMDDKGKPILDDNGNQMFTKVTVYDISETNAYEKVAQKEINELRNEYAEEKAAAFSHSGEKEFTVIDTESEKEITLSAEKLTKGKAVQMLQTEFGYSEAKADLAANKICRDLGLDKEKFLADTRQYDNLNSLKTNIRYQSDDITLRDMRFNSVNFKDGNTTHIVISNGDKTAALTPEKMTDTEMKNICVNQLGMSPQQAEKAVEKSKKIDRQVKSKIEERTVGKDGISHSVGIERTSQNGFTLTLGSKSKTYNFSTINVADKIARDFNVPKQNAQNIIDKAQKQSLLQNKIKNSANKQPSVKAPKPKLSESKGLKR